MSSQSGTSARLFTIEDEVHAELMGQFPTRAEAYALLRRLADLPWHKPPNRCPCTNGRGCSRAYHIVEYDCASRPWTQLSSEESLLVSQAETIWKGRYADPAQG